MEDGLDARRDKRANGEELRLPYWAELWDSALAMGKLLIDRFGKGDGGKPSVLDLGCGMGLAGMVAASLGLPVLFADLEAPALLFAKLNALTFQPGVRTCQLNWQTADLGEKFGLIVGADILYERPQWEHLDRFWRTHLDKDGTVILGEPGRQTGDRFPDWIKLQGWSVGYFEQRIETRSRPIRLFELSMT